MANTIFMKNYFWWLYLVLDHQKKKKFLTRIKINITKKPGFTSQQTQGKIKN